MDIKESSSIIVDALGGFQSFNARLFADEFVRHRRDEMSGIAWKTPNLTNFRKQEKGNDQAWTSVGSAKPTSQTNISVPVVNPIVHENKFAAVVGKTKKKKNKK
jgi:anaerobic glycerol-3-phosphate dehydrogenase